MPQLDLWGVLVTAVVSMVIGALWYSPLLFGKLWMKLSKVSEKEIQKMHKKSGTTRGYVLAFLSTLVMSYVLAYFIGYVGANAVLDGAVVGFLLWLGFIATVSLGTVLWEGKSFKLYVLNNMHHLISLVVMGAILATWS
ncbi:DUF1761 domain-containing protein [Candidatus Woesearchaeota archaeon]|nr:DUF1761 domain-containing protein [Candidatus Woesearchaeota archaeon]